MRALLVLLSAALALGVAAPAHADAPLVETPFAPVGGREAATCLRPTGAPGEVVLGFSRGGVGIDRLRSATPDGLAPGQRLRIPRQLGCAAVAANPDGSAVLTAFSQAPAHPRRVGVYVATRPAGGRFGRPRRLAVIREDPEGLEAAIGARGDAAVAIVTTRMTMRGRRLREDSTLRVLRIAPGELPSHVETIAGADASQASSGPLVAIGVDGRGMTTVAWSFDSSRVFTTTAARGAGFRPRRSAGSRGDAESLALAVAPGGRSMLAIEGYEETRVLERAPDASAFSSQDARTNVYGSLALAVRDDGAAVLAGHDTSYPDDEMAVTWRRPGARFGPAQALTPPLPSGSFTSSQLVLLLTSGVRDMEPAAPHVVLSPGGEVLVSWLHAPRTGPTAAWLARGTLADDTLVPLRLGSPVRLAGGSAPVLTTDGRPGLAWLDGAGGETLPGFPSLRRPGRLHLALAGARPAPSPRPPSLRLRVPQRPALYRAQGLPVTVRCGGPCDVRVAAGGTAVSRTGAGRMHMTVGPRRFARALGSRQGRRVIVHAVATAPGASRAIWRNAPTEIRLRPAPEPPRIERLRARWRHGHIVVTWRTDRPARRVRFTVVAGTPGSPYPRRVLARGGTRGRNRVRHRVVLRRDIGISPRELRAARQVALTVLPVDDEAYDAPPAAARIR